MSGDRAIRFATAAVGYQARADRLIAARSQAEAILSHECGPLMPEGGDEAEEPAPGEARPAVVDRGLSGPDAASGSQNPALNYYGELARWQWEGCLPEVYQQIRDPGAFFAVLGEVIAHRIDELTDHLAGDDQHGEGYLAKVARLTAARDRAQERVLGEYLLLPPDEDRPAVVDRGHPSWAEVDAGQRERLGGPPAGEDRS